MLCIVQYSMCAALCNSASLKFPQVRCAAPGLCMAFCGAKYYGGDSKARLEGGGGGGWGGEKVKGERGGWGGDS